MVLDILVAAVLLMCLLGLVRSCLPAARQHRLDQQINSRLRRSRAALQQLPAAWRAWRGGRQARQTAQTLIASAREDTQKRRSAPESSMERERARREAATTGAQVHDLDQFRQQRGQRAGSQADSPGSSPDRLH